MARTPGHAPIARPDLWAVGVMTLDQPLGHTPDGEPVCVRQADSLFEDTVYTTIEIGHRVFRLDHLDEELIPALRRSLHPLPRAVA